MSNLRELATTLYNSYQAKFLAEEKLNIAIINWRKNLVSVDDIRSLLLLEEDARIACQENFKQFTKESDKAFSLAI